VMSVALHFQAARHPPELRRKSTAWILFLFSGSVHISWKSFCCYGITGVQNDYV